LIHRAGNFEAGAAFFACRDETAGDHALRGEAGGWFCGDGKADHASHFCQLRPSGAALLIWAPLSATPLPPGLTSFSQFTSFSPARLGRYVARVGGFFVEK